MLLIENDLPRILDTTYIFVDCLLLFMTVLTTVIYMGRLTPTLTFYTAQE